MKAIQIKKHGGINRLEVNSIEIPKCTSNKVLVEIKASAINHLDIWVRQGLPGINIPLPLTLGSDGAGIVRDIGRNISDFKIGDEVVIQPGTYSNECSFVKQGKENYSPSYGILGETENGVHSKYVLLDAYNLSYMPSHLSFIEAASMQLVFMTAYQMIVKRAKLQKDETILIYGATSGIGHAAIEIAKDIGANIVTTVGSKEKINCIKTDGVSDVLIHSDLDIGHQIKKRTNNEGVDVVFEHIGPSTWQQSLKVLRRGGRIVTCGSTTGKKVNLDLRHLFMKQQSILGSTMSDIFTFNEVMKKIREKKYSPNVDQVFDYKDAKQAYMLIENRQHKGKIVLEPN